MAEISEQVERQRLPKSSLCYENLRSVVGSLVILSIVWGVVFFFRDSSIAYAIAFTVTGIVVATFLLDLVLNWRQLKFFSIDLGNGTCILNRGRFLTTRSTIVPGSVLSVDVVRGPLLRKLGLAQVKLNGIARFPEIPALGEADAILLQRRLTYGSEGSD